MMFEYFVTRNPDAVVLGELEEDAGTTRKRVWSENRSPTAEDLERHLHGQRLVGFRLDRAINLDFDDTSLKELAPLVEVLNALGIPGYAGPGNTRGSKLWLFLSETPGDLPAVARGLGMLARVVLVGKRVEHYPNGDLKTFLPLFGALNGSPRPLYQTWDRTPVSIPFTPAYADLESLRRLSRSGVFVAVATQRKPLGSRHEAAQALLNLAHRSGCAREVAVLLATPVVFERWGLGDSRNPEQWRDEVLRLADAAGSTDYNHKRGVPFLRELGFDVSSTAVTPVEENWPDPIPLESLQTPLPPWQLGILPPALDDLAAALGRQLRIDPTAPAMAMMAALSAILAYRKVVVQPEPSNFTWEEIVPLWVALIGPPGSGKTPVLREATRPLWAVEFSLDEENRRAQEEYEQELADWLAAKRDERGAKPKPPEPKRLIVSDHTAEKLGMILAANPAVLCAVDELRGLLLGWKREDRASGRKLFLSAYNGFPAPVDRVGRGTIYLRNPQIALLGGIQLGPWHETVKESDDGLLQRITPVVLEPSPPTREFTPVAVELLDSYHALAQRLWKDPLPERLHCTSEALELWREWRFETDKEQYDPESPESWRSYLSKRLGLTLRLAGILSILWGETGGISLDSLARATVLIKDILEPHAKRALRMAQADISGALRLAKRLKELPTETFTRRMVYTRNWGGISTSEEAGTALFALERAGWVVFDPRTKSYQVNPKVRGN